MLFENLGIELNPLLTIAIALVCGLLSTRLMKLIGLPNVTGYLLVGLALGPHAIGVLSGKALDYLGIICTVALGFIAFSIGVEFKISHVREIGKSAVTITFFQALSATLCVDVCLVLVGLIPGVKMDVPEALILGAIATATAPAATLMVVRQYKAKGIVTNTLLPVVALDDAVGLVVFAVSNSVALSLLSSSGGVSFVDVVLLPLAEIAASLVVGAAVGALLSLVPKFFKSRDNRLICTIAAVFLSLGICSLFEGLKERGVLPFGLSDLLVCMMAGAVFVNLREESEVMMQGADRWTPAVFMLFFIVSGAELDVTRFGNAMLLVCIAVYLAARCLGKYFGTYLGATITHSDEKVKKYLGITLFPQAGVAIGMANMCMKEFSNANFAELGGEIVTITMCAVLIYELIGPILTKWALTKAGEIHPVLLTRGREAIRNELQAEMHADLSHMLNDEKDNSNKK